MIFNIDINIYFKLDPLCLWAIALPLPQNFVHNFAKLFFILFYLEFLVERYCSHERLEIVGYAFQEF